MKSKFPFQQKISKDEIYDLPINQFSGKIHIIDTPEKSRDACAILKNQSVLGFDTETKPAFKKGVINPVALVQLATEDEAFLFRLNRITFSNGLIDILKNKNIIKIGVAIKDDLKTLKKLHHFTPANFIDLQSFVKDFGIEDNGLKKLVANILNFRISKQQQTSNWESPELTQAQIEYAATDAWVCLEIFNKLNEVKEDDEQGENNA
ncbi:MAG: 3'-5' exonuclease domain-containing protein 2 [Bacteroidales bacterium]|nr:3'-5' exonuclease domain-containing protein 2 [Bacteroidales bacterium]